MVKINIYVLFVLIAIFCAPVSIYFLLGCGRLDDIYAPPVFVAPYISSTEVIEVRQMWGEGSWGGFHKGLDFSGTSEARFCAVAPGKITRVEKHWIPKSLWTIVLEIKINPHYSLLYVFEPYGITNEADINPQLERIVVKAGDGVEAGQLLGKLYVIGGEYPHLHLGVSKGFGSFVDPFPFFNKETQDEIMVLYHKAWP